MEKTYVAGMTGWVACDYTQGDYIGDVAHRNVYDTATEAVEWNKSWRDVHGDDAAYEGVRFVAADGHLYVDEPEAE